MLCDDIMRDAFKKSPQSVVSFLIMGSWLYYFKPECWPILEDETFDRACRWLYDNFDSIEHRYKHLIIKEDLAAGSLYSLKSYDYPTYLTWLSQHLSEAEEKPEWLGL